MDTPVPSDVVTVGMLLVAIVAFGGAAFLVGFIIRLIIRFGDACNAWAHQANRSVAEPYKCFAQQMSDGRLRFFRFDTRDGTLKELTERSGWTSVDYNWAPRSQAETVLKRIVS